MLTVVLIWQIINATREEKLRLLSRHKNNKELSRLLWYNCNHSLAFRTDTKYSPPSRPKAVLNSVNTFIKLTDRLVGNPFSTKCASGVEDFLAEVWGKDELSAYVYHMLLTKSINITQDEYTKVWPNTIGREPYEISSMFGVPEFPCIVQVLPVASVEAIVHIHNSTAYLKDKSGCPVSGFDKYLAEFLRLGLEGTFNVLVQDTNVGVYKDNAKGLPNTALGTSKLLITDYQINGKLSTRLSVVEASLLLSSYTLIDIANTYHVASLDITYNIVSNMAVPLNKCRVVARQDTPPILWSAGTHNIDVTKLLSIHNI